MRVFVDMDGVLADFNSRFESYLSKAGVLAKRVVTSWRLTERVADNAHIMNKSAYVNKILSTPGFWSGIEPIAGGVDVLTKWTKNKKLDVYIATSPWISSPTCIEEKINWIRAYAPKFPVSKIIMISNKSLLNGDIIIDDKPSHIEEWRGAHAICFAQPWNEFVKASAGIEKTVWRAGTWKGVAEIVDYLVN